MESEIMSKATIHGISGDGKPFEIECHAVEISREETDDAEGYEVSWSHRPIPASLIPCRPTRKQTDEEIFGY